jgi:outer membrane protein assembly factor BamB
VSGKTSSAVLLRVWALLFPPLGLVVLWLGGRGAGRKIFGTVVLLLYCIPYTALVIWLLIRFTGMEVEWRGGYLPAFTYHKTVPNYDAVERSRAEQAREAGATNRTNAVAPAYWTDFRGPNRDGHYDEMPILTNWPAAGPRELWRQPVGGGYGSFVVAEGLAFTIEQRRDDEVAVAYDLATGREVWTNGWAAHFQESMGGDGPRATPTYHEGRIFAQGAEGDLQCLEAATGKRVWSRNILVDNQTENLTWGMASSPLIVDDKVIVTPGGTNGRTVAAYAWADGKPAWQALDDGGAYDSPMAVNLAGQRQLLVVTSQRAVGLALEDGKLLWEVPWVVAMGNRDIAQPVMISSNRFLLSAGYGTGCEVVEVGKSADGWAARTVWKNKELKNKFTSSVFWRGYIYGLDEDRLTCLNAETGDRQWKDGNYGYGQVLLADGQLIILSGEGDLALVWASPDAWDERARFPAIHGKTWNVPAIAQGKLLVRNAVEMACYDLTGK